MYSNHQLSKFTQKNPKEAMNLEYEEEQKTDARSYGTLGEATYTVAA